MSRIVWVGVVLVVGGCLSSTPYGAHREAQRTYEECVALNGEVACQREKALADKRRRELERRGLGRDLDRD